MNVNELARKMNVTRDVFLDKLAECGIDIGKRAVKVNPQIAERILRMWEQGKLSFAKQGPSEEEEKKQKAKFQAKTSGLIEIGATVRVNELAQKMNVPVTTVIMELMKNGVMATINEEIDFETAQLVGEFLGAKIRRGESEKEARPETLNIRDISSDEKESLKERPPVIVVMGHVDHGKTTLLDSIRKTHVVEGETGGITQHIGAYQVEVKGKKLTFLDTPGHEAFRAMRTRGGKVADIAILVVAANDGVQPQTREAIQIIKQEKIPVIVAVNKMDVDGAEPDRVKRELAELDLLPEDWGGKIPCVLVSAKKGEGIKDLLENIIALSEITELRANPNREAIGTIIESHRDQGEGSVATVIIHAGTLKPSDNIIVGTAWGTVRALKDEKGSILKNAGPGTPAQILGLKAEPAVGDILQTIADRKEWKNKVKEREGKTEKRQRADIEQLRVDEESEIQTYNVILKDDVLGSEEAIIESLLKIRHPDVAVNIIGRGLGNITDSDVLQAEAAGADILAFRVRPTPTAEELASEKNIQIHQFDIIYALIDHVKNSLQSLLAPEIIREDLGVLKVLVIFKKETKYTIAGGLVADGKLVPGVQVEVWRGSELIGTGRISELQSAKQKINEVHMGQECGIKVEGKLDIEVGDKLAAYREEKKERKLE